jgi:DNA-binding MarR family transcriptional regulator
MMEEDNALLIHQHIQQIYVLLDDGDRRVLRSVGLTPTQFRLLEQLDPDAPDAKRTRTITELSRVLLCTRGNITRLVQRMQQQGMVHCGADSYDQRLVKVSLTEAGIARLTDARTVYRAAIQRRLGKLTSADQLALRDLTETVADMLVADLETLPPLPEGGEPNDE